MNQLGNNMVLVRMREVLLDFSGVRETRDRGTNFHLVTFLIDSNTVSAGSELLD